MTKWRITYIDKLSRGHKRTTYYYGSVTRQFIIEFFGLNQPDVLWFKIEIESE